MLKTLSGRYRTGEEWVWCRSESKHGWTGLIGVTHGLQSQAAQGDIGLLRPLWRLTRKCVLAHRFIALVHVRWAAPCRKRRTSVFRKRMRSSVSDRYKTGETKRQSLVIVSEIFTALRWLQLEPGGSVGLIERYKER